MKRDELESAVAEVVNHRSDYERTLLKRIEDLIAQHDQMEAEILRLRGALTKIAGGKTYADDPWSIARRALDGDAP